MKATLTGLILLAGFGTWAQTPTAGPLDSLARLSERHYNAQQPDSLYRRLAPSFKQQVSATDWRAFLTGSYTQSGRWLRSERVGLADGFTTYKATFERDTLLFKLAADATGRITGFGLSPYRVPVIASKPLRTSNSLQTPLDRRLDSVVQAYSGQHALIGLSIGILRNDSLFRYGYGETGIGAGQLPDANTLFEIGSVTKTFTATLLADAIRRGLLRLDDPINNYLPDSIPSLQRDGRAVTVGMLANHTSGLPRLPNNFMRPGFSMEDPYRLYDRAALFAFLKTVKLNNTPGTTYEYSNLGVGLLGTVLALRTNLSYEQQLIAVIAQPLGLTNTKISLSDTDKKALARGHNESGKPASNWDFNALAGAGGIRSTVNDLLTYLRAELGNGPEPLIGLMQTTQQITFRNGQRTIGLGWHQNRIGVVPWFFHNGGTSGYASSVWFNPKNKTALIVLSNKAQKIDDMAIALIRAGQL